LGRLKTRPNPPWRQTDPNENLKKAVTTSPFDPQWLAGLQARLNRPPVCHRQELLLNGQRIGSVAPEILSLVLPEGQSRRFDGFSLERIHANSSWQITGHGNQALRYIAEKFRAAGTGGVREQWRDEQLAVFNPAQQQVALAERGVVRLLGIGTRAVHLLGYATDGRVWVQQRAHNKAVDPGLWDTLVGGMVSTGDNLTSALKRETREEAGLDLDQLHHLRAAGRLLVERPNVCDGGVGYVVEQIDWFTCLVPDGLRPINQDGEVVQFALLDASELKLLLERNAFTLDAAWILSREPGLPPR
jgi:8-oxo-dGTP pyrophosphatase MutT (NUDIX family)